MKSENKTTLAKDKIEFVTSFITNREGNVLLLKRRKDLKLDPGKYDSCSGHIKEGENAKDAMLRELNEEIGLNETNIKFIDSLGTIETPHQKFSGTLTHAFHVGIDIPIEKINDMIKNVKDPEMEKAKYVKDIELLRKISEETDFTRLKYTKQMKYLLDAVEQRINKRKVKEELWEER